MAPLVVILARLRRWQNTRLTVLCCARVRVGLPSYPKNWVTVMKLRPRARGAAASTPLGKELPNVAPACAWGCPVTQRIG